MREVSAVKSDALMLILIVLSGAILIRGSDQPQWYDPAAAMFVPDEYWA